MHFKTTIIEFQQVAQCAYCKALFITHINIGNEIFQILEVANKAYRPSFAT